ncbi:MAG: YceI family protein [Flavobacteriaceae bacterium]
MKTKHTLLAILLMPAFLLAQTWTNDPAHSRMGFEVSHMAISDVSGIFKTFEVAITSEDDDFSNAQVTVTVDLNSIDTEVEPRDNHLKSPDFFEVENFPKMTFNSTTITHVDKNVYLLTGDLSLHGITKPYRFVMTHNGTITNNDKQIAGFKVEGDLLRSDFNIGGKFPIGVIGDQIQVEINLEMIKQ